VKKRTNLVLGEDRQEYIGSPTICTPRTDEQYGADGVQGGGLDEHGDNGVVNSACPSASSEGVSNVPAVEEESDDDHEGEEDVERNGNEEVWDAGV
jgi:hypothetical protein